MQRIRSLLQRLRDMLDRSREQYFVEIIEEALAGDDHTLASFLISNELWGGAGSIADQAAGPARETRRPVERLLAELGREQMRLGITNARTETWTSVFEQWHIQNI